MYVCDWNGSTRAMLMDAMSSFAAMLLDAIATAKHTKFSTP